jgi:hypothetical protein
MIWFRFRKDGQGIDKAVGAFEENAGAVTLQGGGQNGGARPFFMGEKTAEIEGGGGEPGSGECGDDSTGPGDALHVKPSRHHSPRKPLTRIRDGGHAGIRDEGDAAPLPDVLQQLGDASRMLPMGVATRCRPGVNRPVATSGSNNSSSSPANCSAAESGSDDMMLTEGYQPSET